VTKFQVGTIFTCLTMDGQTHAIEKAIRPLFADPITIAEILFLKNNTVMSYGRFF